MKLTRQGVRNLDGPQRNGRNKGRVDSCEHAWHTDHGELCDWYYPSKCPCPTRCRKCGQVRR